MHHGLKPGFYLRQEIVSSEGGTTLRRPEALVYTIGTPGHEPGVLPSYKSREAAETARKKIMEEHPGLYRHAPGFNREITIVTDKQINPPEPVHVDQICG